MWEETLHRISFGLKLWIRKNKPDLQGQWGQRIDIAKSAAGLLEGRGVGINRRWKSITVGISTGSVILYLLSRYMRPEGPWQRLRHCPRATVVAVFA